MKQRHLLGCTASALLALTGCQSPSGSASLPDPGPANATLAAARSFSLDGKPVLLAADGTTFQRAGEGYKVLPQGAAPFAQTWAEVTLPRAASGATQLTLKNSAQMAVAVQLEGASARSLAASTEGYLIYDRALGDASVLQRATRWGVEDYVYFPTKPQVERLQYKVTLQQGVSSLRLVSGTLEFLLADGTPGLRLSTPYAVDKNGKSVAPTVSLAGCNYDSNPSVYAPPEETDIGAGSCVVALDWATSQASYPLLVDPEWTAASQLPSSNQRWSGFINKLPSGDVFVSSIASQASQIFRAASGVWSATAASPVGTALSARSVVLNDGTVLIGEENSIYRYDPTAGTFTARAAPPAYRQRAAMITLPSGLVMYAGGADSGFTTVYNSAYLYNPTTNTWAATGSMPIARRDTNLVQLDANRIVAIDGSGPGSAQLEASEVYSISAGTWSTLAASGTTGIIAPNLLKLSNGNILVSGSWNNQNVSRLLNGTTLVWSNPGTMTYGMRSRGQSLAESGGFVYGASDSAVNVNRYTLSGGWSAGPALAISAQVESSGVALNDGRILFVSSTSQVELLSICGDAILNTGEACDDGNATSGDGCSATCAIEANYTCNRSNVIANGDFELPLNATGSFTTYNAGTVLGGAAGSWTVSAGSVDYLNTYNSWQAASGAQCVDMSGSSAGTVTQTFPTVSGRNYAVQMRTAINADSGLTSATATVSVASGASNFSWSILSKTPSTAATWPLQTLRFTAGGTSTTLTIASTTAGFAGIVLDDVRVYDVVSLACVPNCGNGVLNGAEACDDGNTTPGDGCSATCTIEAGFSCPRQSLLTNGDMEGNVDSVNRNICSGYNAGSTNIPGWTVVGNQVQQCEGQGWTAPTGEQIVHLNATTMGGIQQAFGTVSGRNYSWEARIAARTGGAATKTGYVYIVSGATNVTTNFSTTTAMGSASWDTLSGSFTASASTTTMLFFSTTLGTAGPGVDGVRVYDTTVPVCTTPCGNGYIQGSETCDDGNTVSGDGCSPTCVLEGGAICDTPTNLVVNNSFETPSLAASSSVNRTTTGLTGWTIASGTTLEQLSNGFSSLVSALGLQAVELNGTRPAQLSQNVSTNAGVKYVWSARLANISAGTRSVATAVTSGTNNSTTWLNSSSTLGTSAAWDTVGGRFTANSTTSGLALQSLTAGATGLLVDDVRLSTVQICNCDGNFGTGTARACSNAAFPICDATGCQADATATCP